MVARIVGGDVWGMTTVSLTQTLRRPTGVAAANLAAKAVLPALLAHAFAVIAPASTTVRPAEVDR